MKELENPNILNPSGRRTFPKLTSDPGGVTITGPTEASDIHSSQFYRQ